MEHEKYSVSVREAYKNLRKQIIEGAPAGGRAQRIRLLAFTFLRGRSYETVEQTTEAKNLPHEGKMTYYSNLAYSVAHVLTGHGIMSELGHGEAEHKVMQWMKSHWEKKEEPVVATVQQEVSP